MNYDFPHITNICDVLPAIEGRDEIVVAERDGFTIINYTVAFADTFPLVVTPIEVSGYPANRIDTWAAIRRECRGMVFDSITGEIIRRPYHKFFNVNEREETQDHIINLSQSHIVLDKLDGSMIAPFINNGEIIWGTRMCAPDFHEAVAAFVDNHSWYAIFANEAIRAGWTPIFEWCSRKTRIVLDHPEDQLILTAMRNIYSGHYISYFEMCEWAGYYGPNGIPVVGAFGSQSDIQKFIDHVRDLEDVEGYVVRFEDGHMVKLKCDWYVQIHKAKEAILQDRNIVEIILNEKLDDVKAHLLDDERDRLTQFENEFNRAVINVVNDIFTEIVHISQRELDRKTFAIEHAPMLNQFVRPIIFALWDVDPIGQDEIRAKVVNTIRSNLGKTTKYEAIRDVWFPEVKFNEY